MRRLVLNGAVLAGIATAASRRAPSLSRLAGALAVGAIWTRSYAAYRRAAIAETRREYDQLATCDWDAYTRHYNERVPTIEEEFDIWGAYHEHRHQMRYDRIADEVRRRARPGDRILDIGCGSVLVADRLLDLDAHYIGADFGGPHIGYARDKLAGVTERRLRTSLMRADAERMPLADGSVDIVVFSEVIEHLMRPELAVWEISRLLRPGGFLVMTTNNASEMPLRSPLTHLLAWVEKAVGAGRPRLISRRPWVWPEPVDPALVAPGMGEVYLPHTHHIQAETRAMFAAAGLDTVQWSTFEFPPPQARLSALLEGRGRAGESAVNGIEWVAQRTPVVRRLGAHLYMVAQKRRAPVASKPPPGVWPGPFSR